jgi:hypothetical protein
MSHLYFYSDVITGNPMLAHPAKGFADFARSKTTNLPVLPITFDAYHALPKAQQKTIKTKLPYIVPCTFRESPWRGGRTNHNAGPCNLIILDVDDSGDALRLEQKGALSEALEGLNWFAYRTASYTPAKPRMRVVVEARSIPPALYGDAVRTVAKRLGLKQVTPESLTPSQPMFVPCLFEGQDLDWDDPTIANNLEGRAFKESEIEDGHSFASDAPAPAVRQEGDAEEGSLEYLRSPLAGYTPAMVTEMLSKLDPDMPRAEWLKVAAALKHQFSANPEQGYELFEAWSATAKSKYNGPESTRKLWDSLEANPADKQPVTLATVIHIAKKAGWVDPRKPAPHPLPSSLLRVPAFDCDRLLPLPLHGYVNDCAERLQVDPAFVAVPLIVSLGSVLGNRLGLRPKIHDDYTEFANVWGAIMGRPGALKSPALTAGTRPIHKLEAKANEANQRAKGEWKQQKAVAKIQRQAATEKAKKAAKNGQEIDPTSLGCDDDETGPPHRRFICNDASPESLHAILSRPENATGALLFADELSGLIARMSDPERGAALRSFMLSGWNGYQPAVVDRIGRGENLRVDRCCVSVLGGIQPGKLAPLVDAAVKESTLDDGWLQRFSLLVYPDAPEDFRCIDRVPDAVAYARVMSIFERVEATQGLDWAGAEHDEHRGIWFIRFEPLAAALFMEWMESETRALRAGDLGAAVESHFIKYRKAVCALALLFHIVQEHDHPSVSMQCLQRALLWVPYLKSHALRVYGSRQSETAKTAHRILDRLRKNDLAVPFTIHQLKRPCWSGLTDGKTIKAALTMLVDHDWLSEIETDTGGRPRTDYHAHPQIFAK